MISSLKRLGGTDTKARQSLSATAKAETKTAATVNNEPTGTDANKAFASNAAKKCQKRTLKQANYTDCATTTEKNWTKKKRNEALLKPGNKTMSAKSTDTIAPFQIDWSNLDEAELEEQNDYIHRHLSKKEIGEIDFRVMGNLVLARTKTLSLAVNRELLEPISKWLDDQSWLEKIKVCDKEIPDWGKYKRHQRLWTKQQRTLATERLRLYRQEIIKKRKLRQELRKIVGKATPKGVCSHQFRRGFIVPIASPFSPPEQHKEKTRQKFLQALSSPVSDLLPWKLLITTELTKTKKLRDLEEYCSDKRLDLTCKIMHLLQMESEEKISITQEKPFADITLESIGKPQNTCIMVTDEHGKNYDFDWQNLTDGQQKKIITDIHKHRILCKTA